MKTSDDLVAGKIYTREQLKERYSIIDSTINTGIFQPKGHDSIWLFVTEKKTPDRTQFKDKLENDDLHWDGQTAGRKDDLIIHHKAKKLELLLFYRKEKYEHPGAGFTYEGRFQYVSHKGTNPAHFHLKRITDDIQLKIEESAASSAADEIERSTGQGYKVSPVIRKAIEMFAMKRATEHFKGKGYTVADHSATRPYDLLCTRNQEKLWVEVKGTQSTGDKVILTRAEVSIAKENYPHTVLFIVHSIKVTDPCLLVE